MFFFGKRDEGERREREGERGREEEKEGGGGCSRERESKEKEKKKEKDKRKNSPRLTMHFTFFSPMMRSTTSIRSMPLVEVTFQASWTEEKACLRPETAGVWRLAPSWSGVQPTFGSQRRGSEALKRLEEEGQEPARRPTAKAAAAAAAAKRRRGLWVGERERGGMISEEREKNVGSTSREERVRNGVFRFASPLRPTR